VARYRSVWGSNGLQVFECYYSQPGRQGLRKWALAAVTLVRTSRYYVSNKVSKPNSIKAARRGLLNVSNIKM